MVQYKILCKAASPCLKTSAIMKIRGLEEQYGQPYNITTVYVDHIMNGAPSHCWGWSFATEISLLLTSCRNTLKELAAWTILKSPRVKGKSSSDYPTHRGWNGAILWTWSPRRKRGISTWKTYWSLWKQDQKQPTTPSLVRSKANRNRLLTKGNHQKRTG